MTASRKPAAKSRDPGAASPRSSPVSNHRSELSYSPSRDRLLSSPSPFPCSPSPSGIIFSRPGTERCYSRSGPPNFSSLTGRAGRDRQCGFEDLHSNNVLMLVRASRTISTNPARRRTIRRSAPYRGGSGGRWHSCRGQVPHPGKGRGRGGQPGNGHQVAGLEGRRDILQAQSHGRPLADNPMGT